MDFESYLRSPEALHQTDSAQGALLFPGQILDGNRHLCAQRRDRTAFRRKGSIPPPDVEWNNHIGYPAYVVEPGAKLVFTENDAYPEALIRRP